MNMKLFGRKIVLPQNGEVLESYSEETNSDSGMDSNCCLEDSKVDEQKADQGNQLQGQEANELSETNPQDKEQNPEAEEESESDENPKTPSTNEDSMSESHPKPENEQTEATKGQQKTLKKPDKILPCPRCNSMDTKFCYYNNYNVNQPRHFCKSCQRYWTAGGTMRNVPVGAGRRKNKNSASNCWHVTISEAFHTSRVDCPNGLHGPGIKPNGTVLSFGPDSPLCESMASSLNLADKRAPNGVGNGYYKVDQGGPNSCKKGENKDNSVVDGVKNGPQQPVMQNLNGLPYPVPCIPGLPWSFPVPAICPPGYPMPFYPGPYWNCGVPNGWNVPWIPVQPPTPNQKTVGSNSSPNSPLGKHSRNGELIKPKNSETNTESSIVVPKTLRIDDPAEAAKSPIWETLGIKYDLVRREGLFKALQPKGHEKKPPASASSVMHANPAALSRSISFQEGA